MPLYVDYRELAEIVQELRQHQLAVEVMYLESGDYAFGEVGIERKTMSDLINSVTDRRLWKQLDTLRRTYAIPILLLEGWGSYSTLDKFTQGVITTLLLFWKQSIIISHDWLESAKWIEGLFLKYGVGKSNREPPAVVKKPKTIRDTKLEMLQCIQGVGPVTAKKILDAVPNIFLNNINLEVLKHIKNVSEKSYSLLCNVLSSEGGD